MPQVISSPTDSPTSGGSDLPTAAENPEFELLRACCSASRGGSRRVAQLLSQPVRWNVLLELAAFHNVEPLVCQSLLDVRDLLAPDVAKDLERRFALNAQRSLRLTHELLRILACLAQRSIEAIPHKGPVLAQTLYGDVALRQFSDLDILIRASDCGRAAEAVRELGYEPSSKLRPAVERAWLKTGYERGFDGPLGKNLLELQWRLVPRFYAVEMDVGDLFRRTSVARVGEHEVRTLRAEDLLLALCVHASKHAWMRLGWICDIAGVMRSQRIDYGVVRERAAALGIMRIVGVSLWLANQLLECPVPSDFKGVDEDIRELGGRLSRLVARSEGYNTESVEYFRLMLALRERLVDRFKFGWRLLFTPSVGEWETVALPGWLFPLYRVVRVVRVFRRLAWSLTSSA
jgi:Uncharacterised nucleotidyltransferase